jgi:hypothetical protein
MRKKMMSAPKVIDCRLVTVLTGISSPRRCGALSRKIGRSYDEGGAEERAQDTPQAANDDHEQDLERAVDVEGERLDAASV